MYNKENIPYLEMGGSFLLGLAIGFALKKSFKIGLIILGLGLIFVFVLENQGILTLNEDSLNAQLSHVIEQSKFMMAFIKDRMGEYKTTGILSAVAGFGIGLKIG